MANQRLTVCIGGREALPVRAIPYVTGWRLMLTPDDSAKHLASPDVDYFAKLKTLSAYHAGDYSFPSVLPEDGMRS